MEHDHFASAAGLVTNDKGQILLVLNPYRGWEFPGGMVEPHEKITDALHREILEESGVAAEILSYVGVCQNLYSDTMNHDFRCRYVSGELTSSSESAEVRWFEPEEALDAVSSPLTRLRLEHMLSQGNGICFLTYILEKKEDGSQLLHVQSEEWVPAANV